MANDFSKEERVAFEDLLEGFEDALVMSKLVNKYTIGAVEAERANDTVWRPMPYIMQSYDGMDQTGNFGAATQLAVPSTIGFQKVSPFTMNARELRDGLQENRLKMGASQKLASDINVAVMNTAAAQGTVVVAQSGAATGYDDIALCDAAFNELGVGMDMRNAALSSRDYNNMAGNLAERQTMNKKPINAYEASYVGTVAGFDTHKLDYANRQAAATITTPTVSGADQYYTPAATVATVNGTNNVDNRYQTLTVAGTGTFLVGDAFTITGVNSVHHITKDDTGQLKTFRVIAVNSGTEIVISPPIISAEGATDAEKQYQNVTATPADAAAIVPLNIAAAAVNPFWRYDAIELLPARLAMPTNSGLAVMHSTTENGIDVQFTRQGDINDLTAKYRLDVFFGTVMTNPEMCGILLFNQT